MPGDQDRLVEEVAAVNPNTIVVLNTSQPVALPWAGQVKAILEMWWPGDEGGWATAKILLGKSNPAGRLPVTWAKALEDYPAGDPLHPERSSHGEGGKTIFSEGLDVGYRGFERRGVQPLFPFGHGLSYAAFEYSRLKVATARDGGLDVSARIRNTGPVGGDEVPQVYLGAPGVQPPGARFPIRKLVAFDRLSLAAGETKTVKLHVSRRQLEYWSTAGRQWIKPSGERAISLGASSGDIRLKSLTSIQ